MWLQVQGATGASRGAALSVSGSIFLNREAKHASSCSAEQQRQQQQQQQRSSSSSTCISFPSAAININISLTSAPRTHSPFLHTTD